MKKNIIQKIKAVLFLMAGFLVMLIVIEFIYFMITKRFDPNRTLMLFGHILVLYASFYGYYKLTKRYTNWWYTLDEETKNE